MDSANRSTNTLNNIYNSANVNNSDKIKDLKSRLRGGSNSQPNDIPQTAHYITNEQNPTNPSEHTIDDSAIAENNSTTAEPERPIDEKRLGMIGALKLQQVNKNKNNDLLRLTLLTN